MSYISAWHGHFRAKIRRATGPRRVRSRKSFISLFLVLKNAYSARKGGPWGPQSSTNDRLSQQRASKSIRGPISSEFLMPKSDIQKSMIFGILKNPPKWSNQSTRGCQSLGFGTKKPPFGINFGVVFSICFQNGESVK